MIVQAKSAYLIAPQANDWKTRFHSALEKLPDAFWSDSFDVSPEETAAEVEAALSLLVGASSSPAIGRRRTHTRGENWYKTAHAVPCF